MKLTSPIFNRRLGMSAGSSPLKKPTTGMDLLGWESWYFSSNWYNGEQKTVNKYEGNGGAMCCLKQPVEPPNPCGPSTDTVKSTFDLVFHQDSDGY